VRPITVGGQRASALRFDDPRVQALLLVLVLYLIQIDGLRANSSASLWLNCWGSPRP